MSTLLSVSIALLAGLLMTRAFKKLKLPAVTAYLIAGVLIGPYCLGALGVAVKKDQARAKTRKVQGERKPQPSRAAR